MDSRETGKVRQMIEVFRSLLPAYDSRPPNDRTPDANQREALAARSYVSLPRRGAAAYEGTVLEQEKDAILRLRRILNWPEDLAGGQVTEHELWHLRRAMEDFPSETPLTASCAKSESFGIPLLPAL